jgi:hypothetical protein
MAENNPFLNDSNASESDTGLSFIVPSTDEDDHAVNGKHESSDDPNPTGTDSADDLSPRDEDHSASVDNGDISKHNDDGVGEAHDPPVLLNPFTAVNDDGKTEGEDSIPVIFSPIIEDVSPDDHEDTVTDDHALSDTSDDDGKHHAVNDVDANTGNDAGDDHTVDTVSVNDDDRQMVNPFQADDDHAVGEDSDASTDVAVDDDDEAVTDDVPVFTILDADDDGSASSDDHASGDELAPDAGNTDETAVTSNTDKTVPGPTITNADNEDDEGVDDKSAGVESDGDDHADASSVGLVLTPIPLDDDELAGSGTSDGSVTPGADEAVHESTSTGAGDDRDAGDHGEHDDDADRSGTRGSYTDDVSADEPAGNGSEGYGTAGEGSDSDSASSPVIEGEMDSTVSPGDDHAVHDAGDDQPAGDDHTGDHIEDRSDGSVKDTEQHGLDDGESGTEREFRSADNGSREDHASSDDHVRNDVDSEDEAGDADQSAGDEGIVFTVPDDVVNADTGDDRNDDAGDWSSDDRPAEQASASGSGASGADRSGSSVDDGPAIGSDGSDTDDGIGFDLGEWVEGDGESSDEVSWSSEDDHEPVDDAMVSWDDADGEDEPGDDDAESVPDRANTDHHDGDNKQVQLPTPRMHGGSGTAKKHGDVRAPGGRYVATVRKDARGVIDPSWDLDGEALQAGVALGDGKAAAMETAGERVGLAGKLHEFSTIAKVDPKLARSLQLLEWKLKRPVPFTMRDVRAMDFLARWSYATASQIARVGGWRDKVVSRLERRFDGWNQIGFTKTEQMFGGPRLWYVTDRGALHSMHPWLGGVSIDRLNPLSQSHTIGLSSVASWLLAADTARTSAPDILGLGAEWKTVRGELASGEATVVSEKEYRSRYSKIRQTNRGLLPAKYRRALLGGAGPDGEQVPSLYADWARAYKAGEDEIIDAPDWRATEYESQGAGMWLWVIWGNFVWNGKSDDPFIPIEDRLDRAENRPRLRKDLGDEFALLDHLPDIVIVRKRDPSDGTARSIAVELELHGKIDIDYRRIMLSYACDLGKTLYSKVVWLVPNRIVGDAIRSAGDAVGVVEGEDYTIVPFATAERRNSFFTGADIVPGRWVGRHQRVAPLIDPESVLLS